MFCLAGEKVLTFTDANFNEAVLGATEPVLVDFWAAWCGPCKMIAPVIDELSEDMAGKIKIGKVNVDENRETAMKFGVMSIPTLLVFKNGKEVDRIVGYQTKDQIAAKLETQL